MSERPLLSCRRCGAETRHDVEFTGLIDGTIPMCDSCFDGAMVVLSETRRQFNELIAGGMTRDQANTVMIARIDGEAAA